MDPALQIETPHHEIGEWLSALGETYGVLPSVLWGLPVSELLWLGRLRERRAGVQGLPPEVSIVGMEAPPGA